MISIIVPCYNEEDTIKIFYKEARVILKTMPEHDYEMIFVNDGSKDHTLDVVEELAASDGKVKFISFSRNFGKEAAMYAGFANASGDMVAVMDADMQDPPTMLPHMVEILETEEYDCVATRRNTRRGEPAVRSFLSRMFYIIINKIADAKIEDGARDFRLMRREMVDAITAMGEYNRFSKGIFGWVGFRTYWLSYDNVERVAGKTKWNIWSLFKYSVEGIVDFSQAPLSLASWLGILSTICAFVMVIVIVVRKILFGDPVDGWASLASIIIFIGGIQLFCIGIMGQYVAKMYLEVKGRPHYIVGKSNIEKIHRVG